MNEFLTRVDGAMRTAVHRVQRWFEPPLDAAAKPLEIREAIVDAVERQVESAGGGRRTLPFNEVVVTVLAADRDTRTRLQVALGDVGSAVTTRLGEVRCETPPDFAVEIRYVSRPPGAWAAGQRLAIQRGSRGWNRRRSSSSSRGERRPNRRIRAAARRFASGAARSRWMGAGACVRTMWRFSRTAMRTAARSVVRTRRFAVIVPVASFGFTTTAATTGRA
jgi:hypothetical protein